VPVRPRRISDIKPLFTNLAVTSQYEVQFGGLNPELQGYLNSRGVDYRFTSESVGLLCNHCLDLHLQPPILMATLLD
jgi:hypothetical protein